MLSSEMTAALLTALIPPVWADRPSFLPKVRYIGPGTKFSFPDIVECVHITPFGDRSSILKFLPAQLEAAVQNLHNDYTFILNGKPDEKISTVIFDAGDKKHNIKLTYLEYPIVDIKRKKPPGPEEPHLWSLGLEYNQAQVVDKEVNFTEFAMAVLIRSSVWRANHSV